MKTEAITNLQLHNYTDKYRKTKSEKTALILLLSVRNMVSLSMPRPQPPVGGNPYSSDVQKFSSINIASSSPAALS